MSLRLFVTAAPRFCCTLNLTKEKKKEDVDQFGSTAGYFLKVTDHWKSTSRIIVADSRYGSVKTAPQMYSINGLYSITLVKTAQIVSTTAG